METKCYKVLPKNRFLKALAEAHNIISVRESESMRQESKTTASIEKLIEVRLQNPFGGQFVEYVKVVGK